MTFNLCGIGDEAADALDDQIEVVRDLGWSALELRTVSGIRVEDLAARERQAVAGAIGEAGLAVPVIDSAIGNWSTSITAEFDDERRGLSAVLEMARLLGTPFVRVMSYPNAGLEDVQWEREVVRRMRELCCRAGDEGVVLLHENCSGWAARHASRAVRLVEEVPGLGLLFDIGNGVAHGYDEVEYLRLVLPFVRHVHVKDARRAANGSDVEYTLPGRGDVHLVESLWLLANVGYEGFVSLEPHVGRLHHDPSRGPHSDLRSSFVDWVRHFAELLESAFSTPWPNTPSP